MFRFIHAADIHLDSPLRGLQQYDDAPVDLIRSAPRRALENLVTLAIEQTVDFVIIAGDLFDGAWSDPNTGHAFATQMARLKAENIPVFLIRGNHDAQNKMGKSTRLPENVVLLSEKKAETIEHMALEKIGVAIHGQSFAKQSQVDNVVPQYPAAIPGKFNIGILHTSLTGAEGHDTYAPCTVNDLLQKQYDYWALGHVHLRQVANEEPPIVFSGNIQGRHIRETGAKGCYLVTVDDNNQPSLEFLATDVFRWALCPLDVSNAKSLDDILDQFSSELKKLVAENDPHPLGIRVELSGQTALHNQLLANKDRVRNELQARAINDTIDKAWIEKLKVNTSVLHRTAADGDALDSGADDTLNEIDEYFDGLVGDAEELELWSETLGPLLRKLPDSIAGQLEFDIDTLNAANEDDDGPTLFNNSDDVEDDQRMSRKTLIDSVRALLMEQFREHQRP